jgi:bile acid:Na+ symporter, BASS family
MQPELIIRISTACALAGLLLAVGLRLTFKEVADSIRRSRFSLILVVNFLGVPLLCALTARWLDLGRDSTVAMVLLGAAPFAPVVPVFARMARADLALAAGLTSVYPVLSAFLTPWICAVILQRATGIGSVQFASGQVMILLTATITIPLLVGVALNHTAPKISRRWLRPVEIVSEIAGAFSLGFVTFVEFGSIVGMSAKALIATAVVFELCVLAGYWMGHETGSRRVIALGTSNRNIALALLVALQSFPGLQVVPAVVGHGLLLILLGLVHVGYWRLRDRRLKSAVA